jgi:hypothetical protein
MQEPKRTEFSLWEALVATGITCGMLALFIYTIGRVVLMKL